MPVSLEFILELTSVPEGVFKGVDGRPVARRGPGDFCDDVFAQALNLIVSQRISRLLGVNLGLPKDFVSVDVTYISLI